MNHKYLLTFLLVLFFNNPFVWSQDLAEWRGQDRTGVYNEKGLLKEWPADDQKILWTSEGFGHGYASVIVTDDMIFTTGADDTLGYVYGLDKSGKHLWKTYFGIEWTQSYPGTRTTPTYYKEKLYIHSSMGMAVCMDAKSGKILWQEDLNAKYAIQIPRWGISEAPLVYGNTVIFTPGGEKITMIAKDLETGKTVWESEIKGLKQAYNSPCIIDHKGKKILLTNLQDNIVAVNPENGKLLWTSPQENRWDVHPNTPLYNDGFIYSLTGYGVGGVMLKLSEDGNSVQEMWKCTTHDNQMGGAIWIYGNIYASGHKNRDWQCVDAKTGEVKATIDEISKGTCIMADGMIYVYGDRGEIGLIKPLADGFELVSKCDVEIGTEQHWAHLVIDNGVLYCRHGDAVIAYDIKAK